MKAFPIATQGAVAGPTPVSGDISPQPTSSHSWTKVAATKTMVWSPATRQQTTQSLLSPANALRRMRVAITSGKLSSATLMPISNAEATLLHQFLAGEYSYEGTTTPKGRPHSRKAAAALSVLGAPTLRWHATGTVEVMALGPDGEMRSEATPIRLMRKEVSGKSTSDPLGEKAHGQVFGVSPCRTDRVERTADSLILSTSRGYRTTWRIQATWSAEHGVFVEHSTTMTPRDAAAAQLRARARQRLTSEQLGELDVELAIEEALEDRVIAVQRQFLRHQATRAAQLHHMDDHAAADHVTADHFATARNRFDGGIDTGGVDDEPSPPLLPLSQFPPNPRPSDMAPLVRAPATTRAASLSQLPTKSTFTKKSTMTAEQVAIDRQARAERLVDAKKQKGKDMGAVVFDVKLRRAPNFESFGLRLGFDDKGTARVLSIESNSPASNSGTLKLHDSVLAVWDVWVTEGMDLRAIFVECGAVVRLTIARNKKLFVPDEQDLPPAAEEVLPSGGDWDLLFSRGDSLARVATTGEAESEQRQRLRAEEERRLEEKQRREAGVWGATFGHRRPAQGTSREQIERRMLERECAVEKQHHETLLRELPSETPPPAKPVPQRVPEPALPRTPPTSNSALSEEALAELSHELEAWREQECHRIGAASELSEAARFVALSEMERKEHELRHSLVRLRLQASVAESGGSYESGARSHDDVRQTFPHRRAAEAKEDRRHRQNGETSLWL